MEDTRISHREKYSENILANSLLRQLHHLTTQKDTINKRMYL